jgi:RNA polymerase sigma-70 factor, ECF subfamily
MNGAVDEADARRARERELVRRCVIGDSFAQHEFVRTYSGLVFSLCLRSGFQPAEAEDVSQEVMWKAFKAMPRFRAEAKLSTWLSTLTLRTIVDHRRSPARRQVPSGAPGDPDFPEPQGDGPATPESQVVGGERELRVRQALDGMAEPARSVLAAYYLGEMSVLDIVKTLGMPEGTVKTHLHRGRQALRESLRDLC